MVLKVTLEQAQNWLRNDANYDGSDVTDLIEISQIYIESMVGTGYQLDEKAVKLSLLLQRNLIVDMYNKRGTTEEGIVKQDKITQSILDKLSNYDLTT